MTQIHLFPRLGRTWNLKNGWIKKKRTLRSSNKFIKTKDPGQTEDMIKETQLTNEILQKLFAEKIPSPREGQSFRSGFNSSRRLYELGKLDKGSAERSNKEEDKEDYRIGLKSLSSSDEVVSKNTDNIYSEEDANQEYRSLQQKIEQKLKKEKEINEILDENSNHDKSNYIYLIVYSFS
jgi:hypothetical protein